MKKFLHLLVIVCFASVLTCGSSAYAMSEERCKKFYDKHVSKGGCGLVCTGRGNQGCIDCLEERIMKMNQYLENCGGSLLFELYEGEIEESIEDHERYLERELRIRS